MFKKIKAKYAQEALINASDRAGFYEQAASEVAAGKRIEGLWVQALATNEMDEAKAAAWYIQERVKIMQLESYVEHEKQVNSVAQQAVDEGWM